MINSARLLVAFLALLIASAAWAQTPKGYLGADLQDVTKDEAEKLGWETPRGAKVVKPRDGRPAATRGPLARGRDRLARRPGGREHGALRRQRRRKDRGAQVRLRLLRAGRERTVTVTLGSQRPAAADAASKDGPILQLDTGGHMAMIKGLAFTPDGKQLVSAGDDKVIRVWDWQAGKTVRTIRGQVGAGPRRQDLRHGAVARRAPGWRRAAGWTRPRRAAGCGDIRLYDFATGKLVGAAQGRTINVVNALAFSPDGKRLISGGGWRPLGHHLGRRAAAGCSTGWRATSTTSTPSASRRTARAR